MSSRSSSSPLPAGVVSLVLAVGLVLLVGCDGGDEAGPVVRARPVTLMALRETTPERAGTLTGVAESFRSEYVGFEVSGRIDYVKLLGRDVKGPTLDAKGDLVPGMEGDPIARIDATRIEQALESTRRQLEASRRALDAKKVDAGSLGPAEVNRAEAQTAAARDDLASAESQVRAREADAALAQEELARRERLFADGAVSKSELDQAQRNFDSAAAQLEQARSGVKAKAQTVTSYEAAVDTAKGSLALKLAQVRMSEADVLSLEQELVRAEQNVRDSVLLAPYSGRITEVTIGEGGFAAAGAPVVRLTMMNPIKVVLTATAEESREIQVGGLVRVRPRNLEEFGEAGTDGRGAIIGRVLYRPDVADASTRTFRVEVVVTNLRKSRSRTLEGKTVHAVHEIRPVLRRDFRVDEAGSDEPLFVSADTILEEDGKSYVLKLPGLGVLDAVKVDPRAAIKPEKIEVTLADRYCTLLSYRFVMVASGGEGLRPGDILIGDPRPEQLDGATMVADDWALRPGDIVAVETELGSLPTGLYVPVDAIRELNGETSVFTVDAANVARRVAVTVHESHRDLRRIEGEGLTSGTSIAVSGIHYLADGDEVRVTGKVGGPDR